MNLLDTALLPVVIGVTEVIKRAGLPIKFVPLFAVVFSVTFGYFFDYGWLNSLVAGLASVGLYSGVKNTLE